MISARPRYSVVRNLLFPVYYFGQVLFLIPAFILILIATVVLDSLEFTFILMLIVYFIYCVSMQRYLPFEIFISAEDSDRARNILDSMSALTRSGSDTWERDGLFRLSQTEVDRITLIDCNSEYVIRGRRDDLKILARILNS